MKTLNSAIIGLGVGEQHIEGYQQHPQCKVVALCDSDEEVCKKLKEKYPTLSITSSPDKILEDPSIDVVSIASYDEAHYNQITKALKSGKHVFSEKPLCLYKEEAIEIRRLLQKNPTLRLSSNLILRTCPRFNKIKTDIKEDVLGKLYLVESDYNYGRLHKITEGWRGKSEYYSVVHGGAIHIVDLLLWLTGQRVQEVTAYGNAICSQGSQFRFDDCVVSLLKFENQLIGKVTTNYGCIFPHHHNLTLYGTKATFMNSFDKGVLFQSRDPKVAPTEVTEAYPGVHKGGLLPNFIDSILTNSTPIVSEDDVFTSLSVCFAIEQSAKEGRTVSVDYL